MFFPTIQSFDITLSQLLSLHRVFLTPSRTILRPPEEHGENRILRQVNRDYMLRLVFRDDDLRILTHSLKGTSGTVFLDCFLKVSYLNSKVIFREFAAFSRDCKFSNHGRFRCSCKKE